MPQRPPKRATEGSGIEPASVDSTAALKLEPRPNERVETRDNTLTESFIDGVGREGAYTQGFILCNPRMD